MGLARQLVELHSDLLAEVDPFGPNASELLASLPQFAPLLQRMQHHDARAALKTCLQALRIQHAEQVPRISSAELVATLPPEMPGIARPTAAVIREMIQGARNEVIILGYDFTSVEFIDLLANACERSVGVVVICDRLKGGAARIRSAWPPGLFTSPQIFQDRDRPDAARYASMHAKCVLVDETDLLVTSANFTFHGMSGNVEIGIRISGAAAAEARKVFSFLVEKGLVEPFK